MAILRNNCTLRRRYSPQNHLWHSKHCHVANLCLSAITCESVFIAMGWRCAGWQPRAFDQVSASATRQAELRWRCSWGVFMRKSLKDDSFFSAVLELQSECPVVGWMSVGCVLGVDLQSDHRERILCRPEKYDR
eukprot:3610033-Amphidinium_carterae.1